MHETILSAVYIQMSQHMNVSLLQVSEGCRNFSKGRNHILTMFTLTNSFNVALRIPSKTGKQFFKQ